MAKSKVGTTDKKAVKKGFKKTYTPEDLRPHHAKPFRKRHYGLFLLSLFTILTLAYLLTSTGLAQHKAVQSAKELLTKALDSNGNSSLTSSNQTSKIFSAYGFDLSYDPNLLTASAIDLSDSKTYVGSELSSLRPYSVIKLTAASSGKVEDLDSSSMTVVYHLDLPVGDSADLAKLEAQTVGKSNPNFSITKSSSSLISRKTLLKSEWAVKRSPSISEADFKPTLTSYTTVVNHAPLTIVVNSGLAQNKQLEAAFTNSLNSLQFRVSMPVLTPSSNLKPQQNLALKLLDKLTLTSDADAATPTTPNSAEKTSMIYGAAVVKIYNSYCMDIIINGQVFTQDSCGAITGSGFFVGSEGYIATNGHVAVNNPLDIAIIYAFEQASKGDSTYFSTLAEVSGLTQEELDVGKNNAEKLKIAVDKFYAIPSASIQARNLAENIIVGIGEEQPNVSTLLNVAKARQSYLGTESLKQAKLIAYNYLAVDGADTGVFRASDVALIKIEGSNYPSTKLGDISSLTQGSGLSIIGYPGAASTNQLVEATESRATLTSGRVSSIKSAAGSKSQLIETDATIGHGNSGGPAFNDSGEVVGIATYTIDGSGEGDGVFNYVRDIADLASLASDNRIDIYKTSEMQNLWEEGVNYFYQARYSKALAKFEEVKVLYPQHPKVGQLETLARQKIDGGEEIKDFPETLVIILLSLGIVALAVSTILILRHRRKHVAYKEHLASSTLTPSSDRSPTLLESTSTPSPPGLDNS